MLCTDLLDAIDTIVTPAPIRPRTRRTTLRPRCPALHRGAVYRRGAALPRGRRLRLPRGVFQYAQRKPSALSGGERQRVAIARALAVDPRLLVCDEPVSALDVSVRAQIVNLFATLRRERGVGFIFITNDLSMLRQITERVCIMYRGRLVESGSVDRILDHPTDPYTVKLLQSIPRSGAAWIDAPVTTQTRRTPPGGRGVRSTCCTGRAAGARAASRGNSPRNAGDSRCWG
ncbi:ATP-binding cassette domain-containing protein [Embleya sp. NPDC059237]|uniref:ATP-binding cassette domain-containing protein n=1 Tax=Embleya sp. NPDC059237 TaxID=3346784 RepID=UPI0036CED700